LEAAIMGMKAILVLIEKHDAVQSVLEPPCCWLDGTVATSKEFRCVGRLPTLH